MLRLSPDLAQLRCALSVSETSDKGRPLSVLAIQDNDEPTRLSGYVRGLATHNIYRPFYRESRFLCRGMYLLAPFPFAAANSPEFALAGAYLGKLHDIRLEHIRGGNRECRRGG